MKNAVIIFTRVPAAGKTKTRLMPFLEDVECAQLHKSFIKDTYSRCKKCDADILIFYTPDGGQDVLEEVLDEKNMFFPQYGRGLGERMKNAFGIVFRMGYEACVLIGTDIPQIHEGILNKAFTDLKNHDIVINPTIDGGYYLLGMKEEHDTIWKVKKYGTNTVIHNTLRYLKEENLNTAVGEVCRDIDTKEDLAELYKELKAEKGRSCICTWAYLQEQLEDKLSAGRKQKYG